MSVTTQHREAIVFDTLEMLAQFCGANNVHIAHLEALFQISLFVSGTRVEMVSSEKSIIQDCKKICEYLILCMKRSVTITRELISAAVYQMLGRQEGELVSSDEVRTMYDADVLGLEDAAPRSGGADVEDAAKREKHADDGAVPMIEFPTIKKRIIARTKGQAAVLRALHNYELSFLVGPAGTGKTFLATAFALSALLQKKTRHYVITRPVVEAGEHLGFLPGDLVQKILPYLRPIYDALYEVGGNTMVEYLRENEYIETAPLAYMRGRTLHKSIVLLDEAQNCTIEQMKMFLTRVGEGTKIIVNGDLSQSDLYTKKNGLEHALHVFSNVPQACIVHLNEHDVQRSALAKVIVEAYNKNT